MTEFNGFALGEYGLPGPLRDELGAAILAGAKTATSSLDAAYGDEPLPRVGEVVCSADQNLQGELEKCQGKGPAGVARCCGESADEVMLLDDIDDLVTQADENGVDKRDGGLSLDVALVEQAAVRLLGGKGRQVLLQR